jgi:hypothetical protein
MVYLLKVSIKPHVMTDIDPTELTDIPIHAEKRRKIDALQFATELIFLVAASGIEPELSALRGQRVNQLHHAAMPGWEQRRRRETPTNQVYQACP